MMKNNINEKEEGWGGEWNPGGGSGIKVDGWNQGGGSGNNNGWNQGGGSGNNNGWNQGGGSGNTTDLPEWAKCLESSGAKKQTENTVLIKNKKGNKLYFSRSGKFQYTFASPPGTPNEMGTWKCNGTSGYLITMDDGDTWDGTKWIDKVESTGKEKEKEKKNVAGLTKGWVKDPGPNTTWEYQVRDCKWIAKKRGIPTEYVLGDNPKYAKSVKILNDAYPNLVANCKKDSKTDTKTDNKFKFDAGNFKPGILELPKTNYSAEMSKVAAADRNKEAEDPSTM